MRSSLVKACLASACLATSLLSGPVRAAEQGASDNMLSMYGMLGGAAGRTDLNYGVLKGNGFGGGFGVMAGLVFPVVSLSAGDLKIGAYIGGDVLGGSEHTSADKAAGVWLDYRFEGGLQVNVPIAWQNLHVSVRAGGLYLSDSVAGGLSGKGVRVRVDRGVYSAELGFASGGADLQSLTLRWRETFLKCFGIGVERINVPHVLTDGVTARFFYAVDI